jgi:hypothetical protein
MDQIGNMDETPVYFDMTTNLTVNQKGAKTVQIKTTGNEKNRFTCVLSVLANGEKLLPMVIFKGKRLPKDLPRNIIVEMSEKGWMNEKLMQVWLNKVWYYRTGGLLRKKNLLVLDSFEGHKTESVKNTYKELNCIPAIIPGGLTSIVQPLDVCLNKPFKDNLRKKWNTWIMNEVSLTKNGNLKKPSYKLICEWIIQAWEEIPSQMVIKSFLKCGISNADDGSQDHFLYESDELDEEQKREEVVHLDDESATEIEFNNNEDSEDE